MAANQVWKTRLRFFLFLLPRCLAGRCTATRMAGYALTAINSGNDRIAAWCMRRAIFESVDHPGAYRAILGRFLDARRFEAAAAYGHGVFDTGGLLATEAARLTGELTLGEANAAALFTYDRLLSNYKGNLAAGMPAPSPPQPLSSQALHEFLAMRNMSTAVTDPALPDFHLAMARFCFSYAAFDTAARLFETASTGATLADEDRIAWRYAKVKSGASDVAIHPVDEPDELDDVSSLTPDWLGLLSTARFSRRVTTGLRSGIESSVRRKFEQLPDLDAVVADCRRIVDCLAGCRNPIEFAADADRTAEPSRRDSPASDADQRSALPKVFVCGNGWSGSGALYDALTDYDSATAMPDLSIDHHINECTNNEMMFVQGTGGLGRIWRRVRDERRLDRMDLWELFRCHVIGLGAIGHTEHKCANAASNLLQRLGSRYTTVYRRAIERIVALPNGAAAGDFRAILVDTTEQLTRVITGASNESLVIFNNAMFGPNLDMVEIFANFRLAVVVRDPLDQYADRRAQDLKHWMSARRFVPFYRSSRNAFHSQRSKLPPALATAVREVEFERFVRDDKYRRDVIVWSMHGRVAQRVRGLFDKDSSQGNIGIHARLLSSRDRQTIEEELGQWRRS